VASMERRPAVRLLLGFARRLQPQARFLWDRITPGGLGLEFTSLIAALAVGLFVLIGYALVLGDNPAPTSGDQTALDIVNHLQAGWLTELNKIITALGSTIAVLVVAVVAAAFLALRRHWSELAILVASMAILLIAVPELKAAIDRPGPPNPLVSASGAAYPSGHAAYSIIYPWLALTLAIRLRPSIPGATAILTAGIGIAALVGLSRVYLGVQFLSDVSGGWALGVSVFAFFGALAVLIARLRQDVSEDAVGSGDPA